MAPGPLASACTLSLSYRAYGSQNPALGVRLGIRTVCRWTKGFRTGSKILAAAVTLDGLAAMLRLVQYLYLYNYLSVVWWTKFNVSKSEWILFTVSNVLDGVSLLCYGWAFFYMEVYHDEGTYEELAWGMLGLFSVSGALSKLECLLLAHGWPPDARNSSQGLMLSPVQSLVRRHYVSSPQPT